VQILPTGDGDIRHGSIFSSKDEPETGREATWRRVSFPMMFRAPGADQREARGAYKRPPFFSS